MKTIEELIALSTVHEKVLELKVPDRGVRKSGVIPIGVWPLFGAYGVGLMRRLTKDSETAWTNSGVGFSTSASVVSTRK